MRQVLLSLSLLLFAARSLAQPVLPDISATMEKGVVLLSWTCQYDGVKSIAVMRSIDSNFNYSTIGYVKKIYKGDQAFIDGHPAPGKNFYKLAIVFNSGLTWNSNHATLSIDSTDAVKQHRLPANDALQKMIVNDEEKAQRSAPPEKRGKIPAADRSKYEEVLHTDTASTPPQPKIKLTFNSAADMNAYMEVLPEAAKKKLVISYGADSSDMQPGEDLAASPARPADRKKKIVLSFSDSVDASAYMDKLPAETRKKITVKEVKDSVRATPPPPPKPHITVSFTDESMDKISTEVRSRYVAVDPVTGHIGITLPDDVATHHYSVKFFDKNNKLALEIPRLNTANVILDKRNFQKKGTYKFVIRRDVLELEHGFITIF